MAETTASASTSATTKKEGVQIKGKDVIMLNAPEVLLSPDTPLLTTAQDVAGAINELFMLDPGGGDFNGSFRAIIDSGGNIDIVVGEIPEGAKDEQYTDYNYTYSAQDFSEEITTETTTTSGDTTTTTKHTETFSKRIITELYDASGTLIMRADIDDKGNINGYYDGNDMPIYLTEWRS